ncbi:MAG: prepilin peptidase [Peptococcales bacterium]|jgi:leader peptidase (prepilin peptidase)/N-methyltransferase
MEYIIAFIFGITIGSFLNVCIYRLPRGESIVRPPSHCAVCGYQLKAWDLVPILSYIFLHGKCRNCEVEISLRYPLIELLTGLMFTFVVYKFGFNVSALFYSLFVAALIVVTFIDLEHFLIPNSVVIAILVLGIGLHIFIRPFSIFNALMTFLGVILFFLAFQILSRGGLGGGDVKLSGVLGLWLGWPDTALAIFLGSLVGMIISLAMIALRVKKRKEPIPYGPYLVLGTLIVLFAGEKIWQWYLNLIF